MEKDEFGIEVDDDVKAALADPASTKLQKVVDYLFKRGEAQKLKAIEDQKKKDKDSEKPWFHIG